MTLFEEFDEQIKEQIKEKAVKFSDEKCVGGCSKYYRFGCQDGYIGGYTDATKEIQAQIACFLNSASNIALEQKFTLTQKFTEATNLILEMSRYIEDCSWYVQNGYTDMQKELVSRAKAFLNPKGEQDDRKTD